MFISEVFLDKVLETSGLEGISFIILHELAHIAKKHIKSNLKQAVKYGDMKK